MLEPFLTYALIVLGIVVGGSHGIIYLLSIIGLLLKPFWRRPTAFFYPWVYLTAHNPDDIAETPFKPSRLLLIHTLWFTSSVGPWVGITLLFTATGLHTLSVILFDTTLDGGTVGLTMLALIGLAILTAITAVFALWSSWMWVRSLRRSLAHYRRMNDAGDDRRLDDTGYYLAPFRKTAAWALANVPIIVGLIVWVIPFLFD